jgi:hypothetical protein
MPVRIACISLGFFFATKCRRVCGQRIFHPKFLRALLTLPWWFGRVSFCHIDIQFDVTNSAVTFSALGTLIFGLASWFACLVGIMVCSLDMLRESGMFREGTRAFVTLIDPTCIPRPICDCGVEVEASMVCLLIELIGRRLETSSFLQEVAVILENSVLVLGRWSK